MNPELSHFIEKFRQVTAEAERFCFATRAREFQEVQVRNLNVLEEATTLKEQFAKSQNNDSANAMLAICEMVSGLTAELSMWIHLKNEEMRSAWDALVDAQYCARRAMQVHPVANHLTHYSERLDFLEHLLFPPQIFVSTGLTVRKSSCSICGQPYGECDHLKGRAYMGQQCHEIVEEIGELNHVAIVEDPASKHCRMTQFGDGTVQRDILTWREIPDKQ